MLLRSLASSLCPAPSLKASPLACVAPVALAFVLCHAGGCAAPGTGPSRPGAGNPTTQGPATRVPTPALLNSQPLAQAALLPALFELAGPQALEEAALDALLEQQLSVAGMPLPADWQAQEESLLLASIATEASISPDDASRLLTQVRARRALGPARYLAQLRRTAMLRALVAQDAAPTQADVSRELALLQSDRARIRLLVVPSQAQAQSAREQVLMDQDPLGRAARLSVLAQRSSTDPSASAGGLIEGVSAEDPAVPLALRTALAQLAPGEVSRVLALDAGFAIALLEARTPANPSQGQKTSQEQAQARATLRLQRIAMDRLAQRLLAAANITPLDASLLWSWEQTR